MKNIWQQFSRILLIGILTCVSLFSHAQNTAYWLYTLKEHENLWAFSNKHLLSPAYTLRLQNLNKISNPYQIRANTQIKVPFEWVKQINGHAKLTSLSGEVFLILEDGSKQALNIGNIIATGSSIETQKNSQAILSFMDGSSLTMGSETNIKLGTQIYYPITGASQNQIKLKKGHINSKIKHPPLMRNQYEVITPSAVTAIRGTELNIGIGSNQETLTSVFSGLVSITANDDNQVQAIEAGFGSIAGKNQRTTTEILVPPPNLEEIAASYHYNTPVITWKKVPKASAYHVELYQIDQDKKQLIQEFVVADTTTVLDALANNRYKLTVASLTASGLVGKTNRTEFAITANPMPPLLIYPEKTAYARTQRVELNLGKNKAHSAYIIELAKDQNLTQDVQQQIIQNNNKMTHFTLPDNGVWYWRLAVINQAKQQGSFTEPRKIEVSILRASTYKSKTISATPIPFDKVKYKLRLLNSAQKIVYEKEQSSSTWKILNLPPDEYHAQVFYILNGKTIYQTSEQIISWH